MYKEEKQFLESFVPPPWTGTFTKSVKPGRFNLPFVELLKAGLLAVKSRVSPEFTKEYSPGWVTLIKFLKRKGRIHQGPIYEPWFTDSPKLYAAAFLTDVPSSGTNGHVQLKGFARGTSEQSEEALSKGIGELLERYPLMNYHLEDFVRASSETLLKEQASFLDPDTIAGFLEQQKKDLPGMPYTSKSVISWVRGKELISKTKAYIPAQTVFWNYCRHHDPLEPIVRHPNTNGAAGGFSYEAAVVGGIHELMQRDAFFLHWLTKVAPPRVTSDSITHVKLSELIAEVKAYNIEPHFLHLTVDHGVPIYACVLVANENSSRPKIGMGAGTGGTHEEAMFDALREAINLYRWIRLDALREGPFTFDEKNYIPFRDVSMKRQEQRLRWWARPEAFKEFSWFLSGREEKLSVLMSQPLQQMETPKEELARLLEFFRKKGKGYEVYVYEATDSVLKQVGFCSVKVIIPELITLYLDETFAPLAANRLSLLKPDLPKPKKRVYEDFYPWPHPFP